MKDDEAPPAAASAALAKAASATADPKPAQDVVLIGGPTENEGGFHVLRRREDTIELGEVRALKEGQPIHGEVVRLHAREDNERIFNVEVLVPSSQKAPKSLGRPAQIATDDYRRNWEAIFGARRDEKPS